jgi:phosphoribosylglycinamide formyltransferase-1
VTHVLPHENADQLQQRVHQMEYQLLPMVVGLFAQNVVQVNQGQLANPLGMSLPLKLLL